MTSVIQCDTCGALTRRDALEGWLQVRAFGDSSSQKDPLLFALGSRQDFEHLGHCCSLDCLAALGLALNDAKEPNEQETA